MLANSWLGVIQAAATQSRKPISLSVSTRSCSRALSSSGERSYRGFEVRVFLLVERGVFLDQERRAFARGCPRFIEGLPDGRVRRRMTREVFPSLEDAIGAVADSLIGPSLAATTPSGETLLL
jgi:hypothetical protein